MSAPTTVRLRIPSPRPRPGDGPRHQKPETSGVVVRVVPPVAEVHPDAGPGLTAGPDPETVVLAVSDLRAAIPAPREGESLPADPPTAGLRLPSWDPLPPAVGRVELRERPDPR